MSQKSFRVVIEVRTQTSPDAEETNNHRHQPLNQYHQYETRTRTRTPPSTRPHPSQEETTNQPTNTKPPSKVPQRYRYTDASQSHHQRSSLLTPPHYRRLRRVLYPAVGRSVLRRAGNQLFGCFREGFVRLAFPPLCLGGFLCVRTWGRGFDRADLGDGVDF